MPSLRPGVPSPLIGRGRQALVTLLILAALAALAGAGFGVWAWLSGSSGSDVEPMADIDLPTSWAPDPEFSPGFITPPQDIPTVGVTQAVAGTDVTIELLELGDTVEVTVTGADLTVEEVQDRLAFRSSESRTGMAPVRVEPAGEGFRAVFDFGEIIPDGDWWLTFTADNGAVGAWQLER